MVYAQTNTATNLIEGVAFTMDGMAGNLACGGSSASGPGRPRMAWIRV